MALHPSHRPVSPTLAIVERMRAIECRRHGLACQRPRLREDLHRARWALAELLGLPIWRAVIYGLSHIELLPARAGVSVAALDALLLTLREAACAEAEIGQQIALADDEYQVCVGRLAAELGIDRVNILHPSGR